MIINFYLKISIYYIIDKLFFLSSYFSIFKFNEFKLIFFITVI